jgi:hypothetical protein
VPTLSLGDRAVTTGFGGWDTVQYCNIVQFRQASLITIVTTCLSGKKNVIKQKILHKLLKNNSCRENFYKFTKILLKNCTNYSTLVQKLVKNGMPENFSSIPPPTILGKEILISD